jgi:hypothetical protein
MIDSTDAVEGGDWVCKIGDQSALSDYKKPILQGWNNGRDWQSERGHPAGLPCYTRGLCEISLAQFN